MAVPIPTGTFTVRRPGAVAAPVDGHASYRGGSDVRAVDGRRQQVGAWTLLLDPGAWPVTEECLVEDAVGRTYRVHSAALRDAGEMAHVTVDADTITADPSSDGLVDADGNVLQVPVGSAVAAYGVTPLVSAVFG